MEEGATMKRIFLFLLIFIINISCWSFTMYGSMPGGSIFSIGSSGNGYWQLPNISKEDFGLFGNFSSYYYSFRVLPQEHEDWILIEATILNFGPSGKNGIAFFNINDNAILIYNDFYDGNIKAAKQLYDSDRMFQGSYYEWYILNTEELFHNMILNLTVSDESLDE